MLFGGNKISLDLTGLWRRWPVLALAALLATTAPRSLLAETAALPPVEDEWDPFEEE